MSAVLRAFCCSSCLRILAVFSLLGILLSPEFSEATSLQDAISPRANFTLGNVDLNSYDGPGYDAFKPFSNFTDSTISSVSSFSGSQHGGSQVEFFLLSEVAYYDGRVPGLGNSFGVLNANGDFVSVLGPGANPGAAKSLIQGDDEEFTFALNSPEGEFSSIDSDNEDKAPHILAMQVTKAGEVSIPNANLLGILHTFNLQVGDVVLFLEDLFYTGNMLQNGLPSDFDYNDMVVVVRSQPIPEPATMFLLGAGLAVFGRKRARKNLKG